MQSSCLTHIFLIQAADLRIPLDAVEVEVQADQDPRAGQPGFEHVPIYPHHICCTVHITSPADKERIRELHETVGQVPDLQPPDQPAGHHRPRRADRQPAGALTARGADRRFSGRPPSG
ncbi:hypothetical protein [Streptomyces sp. NPDC048256]|uniref:OsmC family protein n=1 Tax=Streptomyces sp. NPDC048256 TaxID=3154613 RepID=UPI0033FA2670